MTGQSRTSSLAEAIANIAVGYLLALGLQHAILPLFGFHASFHQHLQIAAAFTAASLGRSFLLRRLFNAIERHRHAEFERRQESLKRRLRTGRL